LYKTTTHFKATTAVVGRCAGGDVAESEFPARQ